MINYLFDEFFLSKLFSHNKLTTEFKLFFNKILSHTYCAMHITIIWLISKLYHLLKMFLFAVNLFPRHEHLVSHSSMCAEKSFSLKTKTHKASVREGCTCAFGERRITCKIIKIVASSFEYYIAVYKCQKYQPYRHFVLRVNEKRNC